MISLKLLNCETGEISIIVRSTYGIVVQHFLAMAPAIADGWSLFMENAIGEIVNSSELA